MISIGNICEGHYSQFQQSSPLLSIVLEMICHMTALLYVVIVAIICEKNVNRLWHKSCCPWIWMSQGSYRNQKLCPYLAEFIQVWSTVLITIYIKSYQRDSPDLWRLWYLFAGGIVMPGWTAEYFDVTRVLWCHRRITLIIPCFDSGPKSKVIYAQVWGISFLHILFPWELWNWHCEYVCNLYSIYCVDFWKCD